jgi:hypothetical protein
VKTLGIKIVNQSTGKQIAMSKNTQVFVVREDEDGTVEEIDISMVVRAVDAHLHVGEIVTARLDCFLTGIETRAEIESLIVRDLRPRKPSIWRRFRDVTTFGSREGVTEYVR